MSAIWLAPAPFQARRKINAAACSRFPGMARSRSSSKAASPGRFSRTAIRFACAAGARARATASASEKSRERYCRRNDKYRICLAPLRRNVANPCRMDGDILQAIFEMYPLARSRVLFQRYARPPFLRGPDRPRHKSATAIRAYIAEFGLDAIGTKGALIAADPRLHGIRQKILVAIFAVRSKLQRHDGRVLAKEKRISQIGRVIRMTNIPRFRTDISSVVPGLVPGIGAWDGRVKEGR